MPTTWLHFHQLQSLFTKGLLHRSCNSLHFSKVPISMPWETWIESPAVLCALQFLPIVRWKLNRSPFQFESSNRLVSAAQMEEHRQHGVLTERVGLKFHGIGGHVFQKPPCRSGVLVENIISEVCGLLLAPGNGSVGITRSWSSSRVPSIELLTLLTVGERCRGLHVASGSSIRAPRGDLIATNELGRRTQEGGLRKLQIRGKDRMRREVQVLLKILRSKVSWDAKAAELSKKSNIEVRPYHVCEVLRVQHSPVDQAFMFFKWAKQQKNCMSGNFMFTKMIKILGDAEKFSEISILLDDMKREKRRIDPLLILGVIRSYVRAKKVDDAMVAFTAMEKYGCRPNTLVFNCMIDSLRKAGEFEKAEALFRDMDQSLCLPDTITYSMMIDIRGKNGEVDSACDLFQEMHRRGHKANVITYSSLISSLGKAGRFSEARNLLRGMKINGCNPNSVTYNGLIRNLGQAGEADLAYLYYREMLSLGFGPDLFTSAVVISCLIKVDNVAEAHALFDTATLKSRFTDFDVLKFVLGFLCKSCHLEAGVKFFEDVKSREYDPSVGVYNVLIHALSWAGNVEKAYDLFKEIKCKGASPDLVAFNALSKALIKKGSLHAAINVVRFMAKQGINADIYMYGNLVNLLCKEGRFDDAHLVITKEMLEKGCPPNVHMFNILIHNLGKAGQVEKAYRVFQGIGEHDCSPDTVTYNTVINMLGFVGKVDLAYDLFEQMKGKSCEPTIFTYNIMVGVLVRAGRAELGTRLFNEMVANGIMPNEVTLTVLLQGHEETCEGQNDLVNLCKDMLSAPSADLPITTAQCNLVPEKE